jgi:hypothetical protein
MLDQGLQEEINRGNGLRTRPDAAILTKDGNRKIKFTVQGNCLMSFEELVDV